MSSKVRFERINTSFHKIILGNIPTPFILSVPKNNSPKTIDPKELFIKKCIYKKSKNNKKAKNRINHKKQSVESEKNAAENKSTCCFGARDRALHALFFCRKSQGFSNAHKKGRSLVPHGLFTRNTTVQTWVIWAVVISVMCVWFLFSGGFEKGRE